MDTVAMQWEGAQRPWWRGTVLFIVYSLDGTYKDYRGMSLHDRRGETPWRGAERWSARVTTRLRRCARTRLRLRCNIYILTSTAESSSSLVSCPLSRRAATVEWDRGGYYSLTNVMKFELSNLRLIQRQLRAPPPILACAAAVPPTVQARAVAVTATATATQLTGDGIGPATPHAAVDVVKPGSACAPLGVYWI